MVALPLIWQVHGAREQTAYRLALLWCAPAFVFCALAPFDFSGAPEFEWMTLPPLTARLFAGEPGLLEISFFCAGAVWLLREARLPLSRIVFGMMTTALLIEVAQAWEPTQECAVGCAGGGAHCRSTDLGSRPLECRDTACRRAD